MKLEKEYTRIFHYCLSYLQNQQDAEDATQEAFLRFFQHPEYQGSYEIQYLYKIAKNLCVDMLRNCKPDQLQEEMTASNETDILTKTALRMALAELSDEEHDMIVLRYVNQENLTVIARIFNISRFTASRRIHAAMQKLKSKLREDAP